MDSKTRMMTGLFLLIACFLVGYFFTTAQWRSYSEEKIVLQTATERNIELNQALSSIQSFVDTYNTQVGRAASVDLTLPAKTSDTAGVVTGLDELAAAAGVSLMDLQLQDNLSRIRTVAPYSIQIQPMSLRASGSFASFKDFILRLENHQRLFDIERITLVRDESGQLEYRVNLKTYYQQ